jgi:hypothetical protein
MAFYPGAHATLKILSAYLRYCVCRHYHRDLDRLHCGGKIYGPEVFIAARHCFLSNRRRVISAATLRLLVSPKTTLN